MISTDALIDPKARIGSNCRIEAAAVIGSGVTLEDDVVVGPGTVILGPCTVGTGSTIASGCLLDPSGDTGAGELIIGAGVSILPGAILSAKVSIAGGALVMAGTVVQRSVPPHAIVGGNPAQIVGYTLTPASPRPEMGGSNLAWAESARPSRVRGVSLHHLPRIIDLRGNLTVGEFGRSIPFEPRRYFMVFDVPNAEIRGEHAHRNCKQFLICAQGSCRVVADDGTQREEFLLDDPAIGIYLPEMTWGIQYMYSNDAVLLAFASEFYDAEDYIRNYDEFLSLITATG